MQNITPFLWFDGRAEEAMNHYLSIFKNAKALNVSRANGKVMSVTFELEGQKFMGLNAGPQYKFTEAVSFSSVARPRKKSMNCGRNSPRAEPKEDAAG